MGILTKEDTAMEKQMAMVNISGRTVLSTREGLRMDSETKMGFGKKEEAIVINTKDNL